MQHGCVQEPEPQHISARQVPHAHSAFERLQGTDLAVSPMSCWLEPGAHRRYDIESRLGVFSSSAMALCPHSRTCFMLTLYDLPQKSVFRDYLKVSEPTLCTRYWICPPELCKLRCGSSIATIRNTLMSVASGHLNAHTALNVNYLLSWLFHVINQLSA